MFLVDTNVLSEARRNTGVGRDWLLSENPERIFLSVVTLGEIMKGIVLKRRNDPLAAGRLQNWLDGIRSRHAARILPVGDDIALEWGRIAALRPRNIADALIAATAAVHHLTLVTRNVADFADLDIPILNPWDRTVR